MGDPLEKYGVRSLESAGAASEDPLAKYGVKSLATTEELPVEKPKPPNAIFDVLPGASFEKDSRELAKATAAHAADAFVPADPYMLFLEKRAKLGADPLEVEKTEDTLGGAEARIFGDPKKGGQGGLMRKTEDALGAAQQEMPNDEWTNLGVRALEKLGEASQKIPGLGEVIGEVPGIRSGGKVAADVIAAPGRAIRALTTPGGGWFDWDEAANPANRFKAAEALAPEGHLGARALQEARRQLREGIVGEVADAVGTTGAYLGGLPAAALGYTDLDEVSGNSLSVGREMRDAAARSAIDMASDPLMWPGAGKAIGAAGQLAGRAGKATVGALPGGEALAARVLGFPGKTIDEALAGRQFVQDASRQARAMEPAAARALQEPAVAGTLAGARGQPSVAEGLQTPAGFGAGPTPPTLGASPRSGVVMDLERRLAEGLGQQELPPYAKDALRSLKGDDWPSKVAAWVSSKDRATQASVAKALSELTGKPIRPEVIPTLPNAFKALQAFTRRHKLTNNFVHHLGNAGTDAIAMVGDEGIAVVKGLQDAEATLKYGKPITIGGRTYSHAEFLDLVESQIPQQLDRSALPAEMKFAEEWVNKSAGGAGRATRELFSGAWSDRLPAPRDPGWRGQVGKFLPMSKRWGEDWDSLSRAALFVAKMRRGLDPVVAGRETMETLIDYGNRLGTGNKVVAAAKWLAPYATWFAKAPKVALNIATKRPGVLSAPGDLAASMSDEDTVPLNRERGVSYRPTPAVEKALGLAVGRPLSAPPLGGAGQLAISVPSYGPEALGLPAGLVTRPRDTLLEQLGPGQAAGYAGLTGIDPQTGEPMQGSMSERLARTTLSAMLDPPVEYGLNRAIEAGKSALGYTNVGPAPLSPFDAAAYDPTQERDLQKLGLLWRRPRVARLPQAYDAATAPGREAIEAKLPKARKTVNIKALAPPGAKTSE